MGTGREQPTPRGPLAPLEVARIRRDFPQLAAEVHGRPLAYLDNAATTQKPHQVIEAVEHYYTSACSNVHRGLHQLSASATAEYERARDRVRELIGAGDRSEIVFVRGTTEAINLVAHSFGGQRLGRGDEVLLTTMEHHSNIVPWQLACERVGAKVLAAPILDDGSLDLDAFERMIGPRTRMVAAAHVSNVLGTRNPVREMIEMAHARSVPVLLDGAQAMLHQRVDVQELGCDFYAFSSHKMLGPTGVGVLYGKREHLEGMPPYQGGGDMIRMVSFAKTTYADPPYKFEAGTPDIAGVIGLRAAIDYVESIGFDRIAEREDELLRYTLGVLEQFPRVRLIGTAAGKAPVVSFVIDGIHPHDIGTVLDMEGVAVRAGHHCCQPLMERFEVAATVRASMAVYNTEQELDALGEGLGRVLEVLG